MPFFTKKAVENNLNDKNKRFLRRCRSILVKELDILNIIEAMNIDDSLKQDFLDYVLTSSCREHQVGLFLDKLEHKNDKIFLNFVDVLAEQNSVLHGLFENEIKMFNNADTNDFVFDTDENSMMTGIAIKKILNSNKKLKNSNDTLNDSKDGINDTFEEITDSDSASQHAICFTLTTKGESKSHHWIKHHKSNEKLSTTKVRNTRETVELNEDIVVKKIEFNKLNIITNCNASYSKTLNSIDICYIFERELKSQPSVTMDDNDKRSVTNISNTSSVYNPKADNKIPPKNTEKNFVKSLKPPPVPPKPKNLPHINSISSVKLFKITNNKHDKLNSVYPANNKLKLTKFNRITDEMGKNSEKSNSIHIKGDSIEASNDLKSQDIKIFSNTSAIDVSKYNLERNPTLKVWDEIENQEIYPGNTPEDDLELNYNVSICSASEMCSNNVVGHLNHESEKLTSNSSYAKERVIAPHSNNDQSSSKDDDLISENQNYQDDSHTQKQNGPSVDYESYDDKTDRNLTKINKMPSVKNNYRINRSNKTCEIGNKLPRSISLDHNNIIDMSTSDCEVGDEIYSDSHYEHIEQVDETLNFMSPNLRYNTYLDPSFNFSAQTFKSYVDTNFSGETKVLPKNYLLIMFEKDLEFCLSPSIPLTNFGLNAENCNSNASSPDFPSNTNDEDKSSDVTITSMNNNEVEDIKNVSIKNNSLVGDKKKLNDIPKTLIKMSLVFDKDGSPIFIPTKYLSNYKDHTKEPWFYPIPILPCHASAFLESTRQNGCFLVYKPVLKVGDEMAYILSILSTTERCVLHYNIIENTFGDFSIENHPYSFLDLCDLVEYFKHNKSSLITRLKRPLKYAQFPITAGIHYNAELEIPRQDIYLTGDIICRSELTEVVICVGKLTNFIPASSLSSPPGSSSFFSSNLVAVKVLQKNEYFPRDDDDFVEEANTMAGLEHENLLKLLGVSFKIKPLFIITEIFTRKTLKEALVNGEIDHYTDTLFSLCLQLVSVMAYLEAQKYILVRNLTTRGLIVCKSSNHDLKQNTMIKLFDFSKARRVIDDNYQGDSSEILKIKRCSPEVLNGLNYSTKSDVWSAAVAMWEIFSGGQSPFFGMSPMQVIIFVLNGGQLSKPPMCPPDLFELISKCWKLSPSDRPSFEQLKIKLTGKSDIYLYSHPLIGGIDKQTSSSSCQSFHTPPIYPRGKSVERLKLVNNHFNMPLPPHPQPPLSSHHFDTPPLPTSQQFKQNWDTSTKNNLPKSSSENSLIGYPHPTNCVGEVGGNATVTRSDKLRKSFQKIMKINKNNNTNNSNSNCSNLSVKSEI